MFGAGRRRRRFHVIETARLTLRPVTAADVPRIIEALANYDVVRWLGRVPYPYRQADAEAFVAASAGREGKVWFIHDATGLVGGLSVDGELGYWLRREVWGQGYAVEAAVPAITAHFDDPKAGDLPSGHFPGNDRSRRVLEKLGFRPAGTRIVAARALAQQVESLTYRLSRADWVACRAALSAPADCDTAGRQGTSR
jgi:RimJ/RimL family protein N-acetyltransferase